MEQPARIIKKVKEVVDVDPNEIGLYSYYDKKSEYYDVIFSARNDTQAKRRMYLDLIARDGATVLGQFASDFRLMKIGVHNLKTGKIRSICETIIEGKEIKNEISNEA